ncbi:MAG: hypothetical protein Ta2B_14410 [Termitinemataceae bacterium]|nr:MAG: hypothetical protein Ta2B_14410 [Termitinemataceae bacterium]
MISEKQRARCTVCNRRISNPISVKIGIGPVCIAKEKRQGILDFMHAKIDLLKYESGKYILIRDIGHHTGLSVTNDAEYVVEQLYIDFKIDDRTRIFYEDSEGEIDELLHTSRRFKGFKLGHDDIKF